MKHQQVFSRLVTALGCILTLVFMLPLSAQADSFTAQLTNNFCALMMTGNGPKTICSGDPTYTSSAPMIGFRMENPPICINGLINGSTNWLSQDLCDDQSFLGTSYNAYVAASSGTTFPVIDVMLMRFKTAQSDQHICYRAFGKDGTAMSDDSSLPTHSFGWRCDGQRVGLVNHGGIYRLDIQIVLNNNYTLLTNSSSRLSLTPSQHCRHLTGNALKACLARYQPHR